MKPILRMSGTVSAECPYCSSRSNFQHKQEFIINQNTIIGVNLILGFCGCYCSV